MLIIGCVFIILNVGIIIAKFTSLFKQFIEHGKVVQMSRAQLYIELYSNKGNRK